LVHPTPYTFDGYPTEWIRTLETLAGYDVQTFVPGHGEVLRDRKYLLQIRDLLRSVVAQVETALRTEPGVELDMNKQLEAIKKKVDVKELKQQILGDDAADGPQFDYAVEALIGVVFHEAKLR